MPLNWRRAAIWWAAGAVVIAAGLFFMLLAAGARTVDLAVVGIILLIAGIAVCARPLLHDDGLG